MLYIILSTLISNTAYALIAPFLPIEFEAKGISNANIGYIFAIYSVAIIIFSPFVGTAYSSFGYKKLIGFGLVQMGLCFIFLGLVSQIHSTSLVLALALTIRFV